MMLIRFRKANNLSIAGFAKILGMPAASGGHLSRIERGQVWLGADLAEKIYWLSLYLGPQSVTLDDHLKAWRRSHPQEFTALRQSGRAAAKAHREAIQSTRS